MKEKNRKKIAVLFGGCSSEYEVSLQSAYAVLTHTDTEKYELIPIGITREGRWYLYRGEITHIPGDSWYDEKQCIPVMVSPDKNLHGLILFLNQGVETIALDGALPILHGKNGEDGTVQGLLELAGIPVIGCGILSSSLCMDKERAHQIASSLGISVPASFCAYEGISEDELYRAGSRTAGRMGQEAGISTVCKTSEGRFLFWNYKSK